MALYSSLNFVDLINDILYAISPNPVLPSNFTILLCYTLLFSCIQHGLWMSNSIFFYTFQKFKNFLILNVSVIFVSVYLKTCSLLTYFLLCILSIHPLKDISFLPSFRFASEEHANKSLFYNVCISHRGPCNSLQQFYSQFFNY